MSLETPGIDGVELHPLRQIEDDRGAVLHMLRCDAPYFTRFGEVYFSLIFPQAIKAWKRHNRMTQNFAVPMGAIKLVLYDDRLQSSTWGQLAEIILGRPDHYYLLRIPPLIWYGFQGLGPMPALLANCADLPHDPTEAENLPLVQNYIPYRWED
jgi:dTDP-4-dehydrorhamnose 3,5-epimerase